MRAYIGTALAIVLVLGVVDVIGRVQVLSGSTQFKLSEASSRKDARTLLVYLPGILADGDKSSLLVRPTWQQYGDVASVTYAGSRFDGNETARVIANQLERQTKYDTVVFIGSSLGGLVAYDTLRQLKGRMPGVAFKLVLVAAPTGRQDFKPPNNILSLAMWTWWAGPLSNLTTGKLFLQLLFQKPKDENIEPGVDRAELAQRVKEAQNTPFSVYADQIRYMIGHEPLEPAVLDGVEAVYIRCRRDDIVASQAYDAWNKVFGGQLKLIESDTTHVGYNEMPKAFQRDFTSAFEQVGLERD